MGFSKPDNADRSTRLDRRAAVCPFTGISASAVFGPVLAPGEPDFSLAQAFTPAERVSTGVNAWAREKETERNCDMGFPPLDKLIPNPQSPIPRFPPRGFTLIEMLIAITIMVMLMALAATTLVPAGESRRLREAARALNVYLGSARNRAMETGRPCGVTFHRFGTLPCSMSIDQCEVPPCYCGDTEQSAATLSVTSPTTITATLLTDTPLGLIRPGDLVQFNCQGPYYTIAPTSGSTNPVDGNGYLSSPATLALVLDISQNPVVPWPTGTQSLPVPYRIFRAPVKGGASPLQLPAPIVVDLQWSGVGIDPSGSDVMSLVNVPLNQDVCILFSPNGSIQQVYSPVGTLNGPVTQPIFLLVGKRERVGQSVATPTPANKSQWANWQDLDNIWVVVNPQTGLVTADNIAVGANVGAARFLARDAQGMGGK